MTFVYAVIRIFQVVITLFSAVIRLLNALITFVSTAKWLLNALTTFVSTAKWLFKAVTVSLAVVNMVSIGAQLVAQARYMYIDRAQKDIGLALPDSI